MKSFGQILVDARKRKNITIEEAEEATKIRKKTLLALEAGDWANLPPTTFVKGLIKNYGRFLGLDTSDLLAFYRREFIEKKDHKVNPSSARQSRLRLTPSLVTFSVIGLVVVAIVAYLFIQYRSFTGPPLLDLSEPKNNTRLTTSEVTLVGRTWDDAVLKVNGQEVPLSPGGAFSLSVGLNPGVNTLTVTATNRFGNTSTEKRTVVVDLSGQQQKQAAADKISLSIKADPESVNLLVEVDGQKNFEGVIVSGSEKVFTAAERIRIVTKNAGSTKVTFNAV